jgi:hypothetical protein
MAQKIATDAGLLSPLLAGVTAMSLSYSGFDDAGLTTAQEPGSIMENIYEEVAYGRMTPAVAASQIVQRLNAFLARQ